MSLRASAHDTAGNSVTQTVIRAFGVPDVQRFRDPHDEGRSCSRWKSTANGPASAALSDWAPNGRRPLPRASLNVVQLRRIGATDLHVFSMMTDVPCDLHGCYFRVPAGRRRCLTVWSRPRTDHRRHGVRVEYQGQVGSAAEIGDSSMRPTGHGELREAGVMMRSPVLMKYQDGIVFHAAASRRRGERTCGGGPLGRPQRVAASRGRSEANEPMKTSCLRYRSLTPRGASRVGHLVVEGAGILVEGGVRRR